ncbi:hypothetical protein BDZ89DRAFT_1113260 [Hymenopellis radicata]|nr:hypothetical protein BDZ89DRAFT_1113260 [Hymenopellis radicata]
MTEGFSGRQNSEYGVVSGIGVSEHQQSAPILDVHFTPESGDAFSTQHLNIKILAEKRSTATSEYEWKNGYMSGFYLRSMGPVVAPIAQAKLQRRRAMWSEYFPLASVDAWPGCSMTASSAKSDEEYMIYYAGGRKKIPDHFKTCMRACRRDGAVIRGQSSAETPRARVGVREHIALAGMLNHLCFGQFKN